MSQSKPFIEQMTLGMLGTNCYILADEETGQALIVDPAAEPEQIVQRCRELEVTPAAVLLTHGHYDHLGAADTLCRTWQIRLYAGAAEKELLGSPDANLSADFYMPVSLQADELLEDGTVLELAGRTLQVIATPGHTKGGVCYYDEAGGFLFSGDTLFRQSVGRSDLPTGNMLELIRSIREKLMILPDDTVVYPGHGPSTSIAFERKNNPFI